MSKDPAQMVGLPPDQRQPFSCKRYDQAPAGSIQTLLMLVENELNSSSRHPREALGGVAEFLAAYEGHSFEGRTAHSKAKTSFSESEMVAALALPERQRVDYLVYRHRFALRSQKKEAGDFPVVVAVEPTSHCNLRCTMCFQADAGYFNRANPLMGQMDVGLFREIIGEMVENGPCGLVLASRGEPLLHPQFTEMVAYAVSRGIVDTKINTNATALTERKARELLAAEPNTLVFSVDAANKREFEAIRVGATFEQVVGNIKRFHDIREKEFPNSRTRTRISMTVFRDTQNPQEAEALWAPLVDEFAVNSVDYRLDIYEHPPLPDERRPCSILWERVYVWWDGTVNPCDIDYKSHLALGQVSKGVSLKSVWQGEKMRALRESHLGGNKSQMFPCGQCYGV